MAKREKKPKVVKFHLYGNDLEAELKGNFLSFIIFKLEKEVKV
jgi:hypothetical protein